MGSDTLLNITDYPESLELNFKLPPFWVSNYIILLIPNLNISVFNNPFDYDIILLLSFFKQLSLIFYSSYN